MRILMMEPGKHPVPVEIDGSLKSTQAAVGGLIQAVYPFADPVALICNKEGKLLNLQPNRHCGILKPVPFATLSSATASYALPRQTANTSKA